MGILTNFDKYMNQKTPYGNGAKGTWQILGG